MPPSVRRSPPLGSCILPRYQRKGYPVRARQAIPGSVKVNLSMVSVKWGDVLSAILPGSVLVLAIAPWFPDFWKLVADINQAQLSTGVAFLFAAAIGGGILDGFTRITWEQFWLCKRMRPPKDTLDNVTPENLPLYEMVVQSSYKYAMFYANLAWACLALAVTYPLKFPLHRFTVPLLLVVLAGMLLRASHIQWKYYVGHVSSLFSRSRNAAKPSTDRNQSSIHTKRENR